jgi:ABC-2 type transport system permease protein
MNKMIILLKREIWEHKVSFVYLPIVVASLCAFFVISGLGVLQLGGDAITIQADIDYDNGNVKENYDVNDTFDSVVGHGLREFSGRSIQAKEKALNSVYLSVSAPLILTLWLVMISYLVMSLYQDRKDRSILFWKSMPVSDFATVISKVIAALVIAPAIYLLACMGLHIVLLLVSSVSAMGYDVPVWSTLWAPSNILTRWAEMAVYFLIVGLWCLPFYAWLLLVSSRAKSVPLAWMIGLPLVLVLLELMFANTTYVKDFIGQHIAPISISEDLGRGIGRVFDRVMNLELIVSVLIGCVFIYGAVIFRGKADEL